MPAASAFAPFYVDHVTPRLERKVYITGWTAERDFLLFFYEMSKLKSFISRKLSSDIQLTGMTAIFVDLKMRNCANFLQSEGNEVVVRFGPRRADRLLHSCRMVNWKDQLVWRKEVGGTEEEMKKTIKFYTNVLQFTETNKNVLKPSSPTVGKHHPFNSWAARSASRSAPLGIFQSSHFEIR